MLVCMCMYPCMHACTLLRFVDLRPGYSEARRLASVSQGRAQTLQPRSPLSAPAKNGSHTLPNPVLSYSTSHRRIYYSTTMHLSTHRLLALGLIPLLPLVLGTEVTTEYTQTNECTRKTERGDTIQVHYRGTLASDGSMFDASYDRGQPLRFSVGKGMVIKG